MRANGREGGRATGSLPRSTLLPGLLRCSLWAVAQKLISSFTQVLGSIFIILPLPSTVRYQVYVTPGIGVILPSVPNYNIYSPSLDPPLWWSSIPLCQRHCKNEKLPWYHNIKLSFWSLSFVSLFCLVALLSLCLLSLCLLLFFTFFMIAFLVQEISMLQFSKAFRVAAMACPPLFYIMAAEQEKIKPLFKAFLTCSCTCTCRFVDLRFVKHKKSLKSNCQEKRS